MDDELNRLPCGYVSFRDDGTVLSVNQTLLDLLGRNRSEVEGQRFDALLAPGARVFYHTHFVPMLKLHGAAEEVYVVLRAADGRDLPMLAYGTRRDDVNECVFIRVTRREQYQDELARARERLIGILGHDLRVPLTSVTLGAEILVRTENLTGEGQQTAIAILSSARRAARMTNDLLDFSRIRFAGGIPIARQPMDLSVVAQKVIAELRSIHPSAKIVFSTNGDCRGVWDPDRVAQVVANLTGNAIHHRRADAPVAVRLEGHADAVVVEVRNPSDNTPPEDLFTAFRQGERSTGLGLGLFIVREIMKAHGGTVTAVTADGEFKVRASFPRA